MRNKYITKILPALVGALVVAGGGCMSKPLSQTAPTSSSTVVSTTPVEVVSSTASSTTSTSTPVSLVDRPVSEWPRYEFKELGFSIQLPYKNIKHAEKLHDCAQEGDRCDGPNMYYYLAYAGDETMTAVTVMAKSQNHMFDGAYSPFATSSLSKTKDGEYRFKNFNYLKTIQIAGRKISFYKDGVQFFYEWIEDEAPKLITVAIPLTIPNLPVAALIFDERNTSLSTVQKIINTTKFVQ